MESFGQFLNREIEFATRRTGIDAHTDEQRVGFGVVGPSLWFLSHLDNDDESPLQKQAQEIA